MKKDYDKFGIAVSLIILVLFIAVFLVFIYSKTKNAKNANTMNKNATNKNKISNEKSNEKFENLNASTEILNLDNLLDAFKNPNVVSEMVASSSLENGIKSIQSSINTMNTEIENLKKKEQLPKGSIMLWFKEGTPGKNWVPCDGATYFVQYEDGTEENGVKVPDFRGKFIKGVGGDASEFNSGGSDKITADNLPVHSHIVEEKTGLRTNSDGAHYHGAQHYTNIPGDRGDGHVYNGKEVRSTAQDVSYWYVDNGSHSHGIPNHKHTITPSINERLTDDDQQIFEPKYQEAKFIYYLGSLAKEPTLTIEPTTSSINQEDANSVPPTP
jgi:hypothetical protein